MIYMEKKLELIKKLKEEFEELKKNFETAYINYTNNNKDIEKEENNIKEIENRIVEKEKKQLIIFVKKAATFIVSMLIASTLAPPVAKEIIFATIFISMTSILFATLIPRVDKKLYDLYLKLSPKSKQLENEINKLEEEISLKKEAKQQLELIKKELNNKLNDAELNMKNKEKELRETEEIYFSNIFNTNNISTTRNEPHINTTKVRVKQKNNIQ